MFMTVCIYSYIHITALYYPIPIVQEAGWAPGPVWIGAENLVPLPGFNPRTVQPVASRYTDWVIRSLTVTVPQYYPQTHTRTVSTVTNIQHVLGSCDRASWNVGWRERNQQDATNPMFIIKLLSQHVSGIIMPIIRTTRPCITAYGVLHWLCELCALCEGYCSNSNLHTVHTA